MNDIHFYEVNLTWNGETRGKLASPVIASKTEIILTPKLSFHLVKPKPRQNVYLK